MSNPMVRLGALVEELKRRGVLRVAAVYLVGAWLMIQVADVTFPRLGLPDWTVTFVIVTGALLFPVVVGLAWVFDFTARGLERTEPRVQTHAAPRAHRPHATIAAAALMAVPLIGVGLWWVNDARGYSLDPSLVAITPFRVAGAAEDAHYLREGLMDLIAARIGGAGSGLVVVSPRTVSRALRDELGSMDADPEHHEAMALARDLGAGRLLEGEVVGGRAGERVTVTASLYDVISGHRMGEPVALSVDPDSLHSLVDRIAARLVAAGGGLSGDRLAHLTTESLPALRLYIEGEQAARRGGHQDAVRAFDRALSIDSTFTLAALGLLRASGWSPSSPAENSYERALELARRGVDRLSESDRTFLEAFMGGGPSATYSELIRTRMRGAERAPDSPELHALAGDGLFHYGNAAGFPDAGERSRVLFEQTVAMDSTFVEPLIHLYDLAVNQGDTASMRRWGDLLLAIDSTTSWSLAVRYGRSIGLAGPQAKTAPFALGTLTSGEITRLLTSPRVHTSDASREALDTLLGRFDLAMPDEQTMMARAIHRAGMRGGRPSLIERLRASDAEPPDEADLDRAWRAMYWHRDADEARAARADVNAALDSLPAVSGPDRERALRRCTLGHLALVDDGWDVALRIAAEMDAVSAAAGEHELSVDAGVCASALRTSVAVMRRDPDALRRLDEFDARLAAGTPIDVYLNQAYQIAIADLWERMDRPERALAASRRRIYLGAANLWHTEMLGIQGRLADRLGQRDEALEAYRDYVAWMRDAEPPFAARRDAARARLRTLLGD